MSVCSGCTSIWSPTTQNPIQMAYAWILSDFVRFACNLVSASVFVHLTCCNALKVWTAKLQTELTSSARHLRGLSQLWMIDWLTPLIYWWQCHWSNNCSTESLKNNGLKMWLESQSIRQKLGSASLFCWSVSFLQTWGQKIHFTPGHFYLFKIYYCSPDIYFGWLFDFLPNKSN